MHRIKDAFGEAPQAFDAFVQDTLHACRESPAPQRERGPLRAALLAALALLLVVGAALGIAHGLGGLPGTLPQSTPSIVLRTASPYTLPPRTAGAVLLRPLVETASPGAGHTPPPGHTPGVADTAALG